MRLDLLQLRIADGEPDTNLDRAIQGIRAASRCDLILLPELFTTGYAHDAWQGAAAKHTPAAVKRLGALATELKMAIAAA